MTFARRSLGKSLKFPKFFVLLYFFGLNLFPLIFLYIWWYLFNFAWMCFDYDSWICLNKKTKKKFQSKVLNWHESLFFQNGYKYDCMFFGTCWYRYWCLNDLLSIKQSGELWNILFNSVCYCCVLSFMLKMLWHLYSMFNRERVQPNWTCKHGQ